MAEERDEDDDEEAAALDQCNDHLVQDMACDGRILTMMIAMMGVVVVGDIGHDHGHSHHRVACVWTTLTMVHRCYRQLLTVAPARPYQAMQSIIEHGYDQHTRSYT